MFFKESEIGKQLLEIINNTEGVKVAVLTNSFIKKSYDSNTDVDLLFIGDMKVRELSGAISKLEKDLKRDIRFSAIKKEDFDFARKKREPFLMNILEHDKIILYGQISDIL
jgi:predicted nucleotidyltransferase